MDQDVEMLPKKSKKALADATNASVKKEMARPRMAKSARIAALSLLTARIPGQPSTTMPAAVYSITTFPPPIQPVKARNAGAHVGVPRAVKDVHRHELSKKW
jgi:hypothetical protein